MRNIVITVGIVLTVLPGLAQAPITLNDAIAAALAGHPALREAEERARASQAAADRAAAPARLQVSAGSRYTHVGEVPTLNPYQNLVFELGEQQFWTNAVTAQQVVYSGGRLPQTRRSAERQAQAVAVQRERARQLVAFDAERAFLTLLTAQRDAEVARQALVSTGEQLAAAQARHDAGTAARFDILRAEVAVEEARQDVIRAEAAIIAANAALVRALGQDEGQYLASDAGMPDPPTPPALAALLERALAERPELRALGWQLRAAEAAIAAARGERMPTVALVADYQMVTPESPLAITRWSAGAVASLPILDGGAIDAKIREAEAQRAQWQAAQAALRNAVEAEVRQAHARLTAAASQVAVARKRQEQADELFRIAGVRYEAGVGTAVEIADAQTQRTRARQGVTRALNDWHQAAAELRLATGASPLPRAGSDTP